MGNVPQMFHINPETEETQALTEVDFADLGLRERQDIQEWIAAHPSILGDDLLIIGKEFSGFEGSRERPDLLAVDTDGKLVVIELKRDDSGEDVHWQAIKYASYFSQAKVEQIVGILARYRDISESEAETALLQHLNAENADDLNALNHDQRIILASHRFAPAAASAVLWLNKKAPSENLITCVQLMPYRDEEANSLYLHASTIIPVPGIDIVGVGSILREGGGKNPNASDEVTCFLRNVGELAKNELPNEMKPDKTSRWAGSWSNFRYYASYYSRSPWRNGHTFYEVNLFPPCELENWKAHVFFQHTPRDGEANFDFQQILEAIGPLPEGWQVTNNNNRLTIIDIENEELNDDFAYKIANVLRELIKTITPVVNELASESDVDSNDDESDREA